MTLGDLNFEVSRLGDGRIPSPLKGTYFVKDDERVLFHSDLSEVKDDVEGGKPIPSCTRCDPEEMAEKISQRQPQLVRKLKGYPDAVRTGG